MDHQDAAAAAAGCAWIQSQLQIQRCWQSCGGSELMMPQPSPCRLLPSAADRLLKTTTTTEERSQQEQQVVFNSPLALDMPHTWIYLKHAATGIYAYHDRMHDDIQFQFMTS